MRTADTPSVSARFVAWLRGIARCTPGRDLAPDEYSVRLSGQPFTAIYTLALWFPTAARLIIAHTSLQLAALTQALRSVEIDDAVRSFVAAGGTQVVVMGAGLDARSLRLLPTLSSSVRLWEVDSPGSSREKQAQLQRHDWLAMTQSSVTYVAQDFEEEPLSSLPDKLAHTGLRLDAPTLTIMEGVCMYLHAATVRASFDVARAFGGSGSQLVVNHLGGPPAFRAEDFSSWRWWTPRGWSFWPLAFTFFRVWAGERIRIPSNGGLDLGPDRIGDVLAEHGWKLVWDRDAATTAEQHALPKEVVARLRASGMMVALARRQD